MLVRITVVLALALAINACGGTTDPGTESTDPATGDLRAFVTNMGFDITVSPLAEILEDNRLDLVEYESVASDVVTCLASEGIDASMQFAEVPGGSGYEFVVRPPASMGEDVMQSIMAECEEVTQFIPVAFTWASIVGSTESESAVIDRITDQCLVDAGIEGGREAVIGSSQHTDAFLACFAEATAEVLAQR